MPPTVSWLRGIAKVRPDLRTRIAFSAAPPKMAGSKIISNYEGVSYRGVMLHIADGEWRPGLPKPEGKA